jgi:hypothetical protein
VKYQARGYIGQTSKKLHFAVQSLRSVTQLAQLFEALIFGGVRIKIVNGSCQFGHSRPHAESPYRNARMDLRPLHKGVAWY